MKKVVVGIISRKNNEGEKSIFLLNLVRISANIQVFTTPPEVILKKMKRLQKD